MEVVETKARETFEVAPPSKEKDEAKLERLERNGMFRAHLMPLITFIIVAIIAMVMEVFYFVPLWDPLHHLNPLEIKLVTADSGILLTPEVGFNLGDVLMTKINNTDTFTWIWEKKNISSLDTLRSEVSNDNIWGALYVPENFTRVFFLSVLGKMNQTYSNSLHYICDESKQYTSNAVIDSTITEIVHRLNQAIRQMNLTGLGGKKPLALASDVLVTPVQLTRESLHTVPQLGQYFGQYVVFVCLWIGTLFLCMCVHFAFRKHMSEKTTWSFAKVVHWRIGTIVGVTFLNSLFVAGILAGLAYPMAHGFGELFCILWLISLAFAGFICMSYGLFANIGIIICILGIILQLVTCDGIYSYHTLPAGFRWITWVFPMSHGVSLMRYSGFDASSGWRGAHLGVPFCWMIGGFALAIVGWYFGIGKRLIRIPFKQGHDGFYHFSQLFI